MRFAAIDIGSNAIRLLIKDIEVGNEGRLEEERVAYYRVPLRLGTRVFDSGKISSSKATALCKVMSAFKLLMEVQEVQHYRACATSALRNAENRWSIIERIQAESRIVVDNITGEEEAQLIYENFRWLGSDRSEQLLTVDVGGGSTELTVLRGNERIAWKSFRIGTVRMLKKSVDAGEWKLMKQFLEEHLTQGPALVAGTGGNINRYHKLARLKQEAYLNFATLEEWVRRIEAVPLHQRSTVFGLKVNRADVIVPAGKIYLEVLRLSQLNEIWVPNVGLSDGIILRMAEGLLTPSKG